MKIVWTTIKALLSSKKFVASLIAAVVWVGGKLGLHLDNDVVAGIVGPIIAYVLAQGAADLGKGAAQLSATAPAEAPKTEPAA